jgi:hypothetical protein
MKARVAVALALLPLLAASCSAVRAATGADDGVGAPLTVVLFDVSRSTDDPDVRAGYLATFERVLDHAVAEHGTVVADVIDDNPLAHATYPIAVTFDACDPLTDNRLACDAEAGESRAAAVEAARAILARDGGRAGTDIHGALALAERVFDSYPEAGERSLVVLSDMVERSARLNLGRPGFDEAAIDAELDALAADALIPDLTGVRVYVVGAGVQQASGLDADRFLAVQRFWQAFAERAGATLPNERYGAALVRFP